MTNFESRVYSISDFLEWDEKGQLVLNPKFQRRSVWTPTARSFLMDTIVRGKPIPKVFLRQKINVQTRQSIREVVDGQQRLKTILSYVKDGFAIHPKHNPKYGGKFFSQLAEVDDAIQENILKFEISTDLLVNLPDSEILDIFSRLNSYSVTLNEQEKINANHFGPFKTLADEVAHSFNSFWVSNKILKDTEILRMADVTMTADLLIAMIEGIRSKKDVPKLYTFYESSFTHDTASLTSDFSQIIADIQNIFPNGMKDTEFKRIHIFYTLFTTLYHLRFGLSEIAKPRLNITAGDFARIASRLDSVNSIFSADNKSGLDSGQQQFLEDSQRATTDKSVRKRRTEYLIDLILQ
jgi:hypothetical protein